jgi:hypothetical protein
VCVSTLVEHNSCVLQCAKLRASIVPVRRAEALLCMLLLVAMKHVLYGVADHSLTRCTGAALVAAVVAAHDMYANESSSHAFCHCASNQSRSCIASKSYSVYLRSCCYHFTRLNAEWCCCLKLQCRTTGACKYIVRSSSSRKQRKQHLRR